MYKLENNVEWTNDLKNAFKHNVTKAKIIYNNTEINHDNGIKEITLEDSVYVPDVGFIGQATAKKATIILLDNEQTINLENKEFELYIGADYNNQTYYINYGKFIVNEPPENDSTNGTIKIIAYDYMIKFNKNYQDQATYPISLKNYLINICTQAGIELGTTTFPNENFMVEDNQFEGKQLREVIKHIAKCAFSWARIGQDNKLYLDFNTTGTPVESFGINEYKQDGFKKANEYYGPINKVTYADSDIQGQEESIPDNNSITLNGVKELIIYDNFFAYTTQKRQQLIQAGSVLFGLTYMPVTQLELTGAIYLDCTDFIEVLDEENNSITTRVFSHTIKYNGVISDTVSSEALSTNQETYKNVNTPSNTNNRIEIIVDRATKKIQSIILEIGDRSQKQTTITQDLDSIVSQVEALEDLTDTQTGTKTITLQNCVIGPLLELHIYGNNSVFDYLYPEDDLYPENNLYPYGDSEITVTDKDNNVTAYDLGIKDVLRQNGETKDEYILKDGKAKIIRRIATDGTILNEEIEEDLGDFSIDLSEDTNIIAIKNYTAKISAKYAIKNVYTEIFATKVEAETKINQTAQEINLEVNKKVDESEFGTLIRQSSEAIKFAWNQISQYIKFEGQDDKVVLNIYDENDNKLMTLSQDGQDFFDSIGNKLGSIGIIRQEDKDTLAFSMPVDWENIDDSRNMAWGVVGPSGNFLPIFYLAGYYGEEFAEYGGELVVEGKLTAAELGITNNINFEATSGLSWDEYRFIRPALVFNSGFFSQWLTYGALDGHEFFVNNNSVFSMDANNIYIKKPIWLSKNGNTSQYGYDGFPVIGIDTSHSFYCQWTGGNLYFYVDDTQAGWISDERLKKEIKQVDEKFLNAINELDIKQFKADNRNGLISFGIIAQELEEKFKKYNINPEDYEIIQKVPYKLNEKELYYTIEYTQFLILKQLATDKKIEELQRKDKEKNKIIQDLIKRIEKLEGKNE